MENPRPRKMPAKKAKAKGLPSPCPTPFLDMRTSECFVYQREDYPVTATCIRFRILGEDMSIPELAFDWCLDILRPIASKVHACIHATESLIFIVDISEPTTLSRLLQVAVLTMPGTATEFLVCHGEVEKSFKDCLEDLEMEMDLDNDLYAPSSEDERPQPRKQAASRPAAAARHVRAAVQPTPPYCPAKPSAAHAPAAKPAPPPSAPAPASKVLAPSASQPAASPSTAPAALIPADVLAETPEFSSRSALPASQPEATQPTAATPNESAVRHRRRFRFKAVDFSTLKVAIPPMEPTVTLLIRPVSSTNDLRQMNSQKVARELGALGEPTRVRDIRNGGLAVDFPSTTATAPLVALNTLAGCKVICTLPTADIALSAVVSGVHPEISEEDILADMITSPPVKLLAVKRLARPGQLSWSIKITVEGTQLPDRALLYGRSRRVAAFVNKPLQCQTCGRFGHTSGVCRSSLRCWTCGEAHESSSCTSNASPTCPNCGGPHPADAVHCPARQLEIKVCAVQAEQRTSFRTARIAVQQAAKSYAAVTKGPAAKAPASHNRPPQLLQQPQLAGGFKPSIAQPRLPQPTDHQLLLDLFRGLLQILTAATASSDLSGALLEIAALFRSHAPGADATAFAV